MTVYDQAVETIKTEIEFLQAGMIKHQTVMQALSKEVLETFKLRPIKLNDLLLEVTNTREDTMVTISDILDNAVL